MLVNSKEIFKLAQKEGYAIGAYNINNLEWAKYILEACEEDKAPVILSVSESAINYMGGYNVVYNIVTSLIKDLNIKIPVVLHLDHAKEVEYCKKAIDAGFTSVMIDASNYDFDINVQKTLEVIDYVKSKNVSVEAELGTIDSEKIIVSEEDAEKYVFETGVDSLAPAIGNKHGICTDVELDFELLGKISKKVHVPLVLHGASCLDENKIKTAIFCGVTKINISTDIMLAWSKSIRKYLEENKDVYDPRKIISSGEKAIKETIHYKNKLFGSVGKGAN